MKFYFLGFFLVLHAINGSSQSVLIEEFTNIGSMDYAQSAYHIENTIADIAYDDFCIIEYHTDFPANDPYSVNVIQDVMKRMETLGDISTLPSVIVDGTERPAGTNYTGATLNVTGNYLDSIRVNKDKIVNFYAHDFVFDDDFKGFDVSIGMSLFGTETIDVRLYQVLVEEFIDDNSPTTTFGTVIPTNIFRGFINYGEFWEVPGNGSTQGWRGGTVPDNIVDLNNLKVIVFATDDEGYVLNCTSIHAPYVERYKASYRNNTNPQQNYCQNTVTPSITIKNEGALDLTGLNIEAIVNKDTFEVQLPNTLAANNEITYDFNEIILTPGDYDIKVKLVSVENAPADIDIRETSTVSTDVISNYLVYDIYETPDEGFETGDSCSLGNFYVRAQTKYAFAKVANTNLGVNYPVGAYGNSDHCLLVDQWNWVFDDASDGNLTNDDDDPNYGFLHYNGFDLSQVKFPVLQFDCALNYNSPVKFLQIGISGDSCSNSFELVKEFRFNELFTGDGDLSNFFIPDSTQWKTIEIPLFAYEELNFAQLRFFVRHRNANAIYFDNIKVVSGALDCPVGDVHLSSQAEVDSFVMLMNGCNIIPGNLCIGYCDGENLESDIVDISGLSPILEITGSLTISQNPLLTSVLGLYMLRIVGDDFQCSRNNQLTTLFDISPDKYIGGNIRILDNPLLEKGINFSKLDIINGDLIITGNPMGSYLGIDGPIEVLGDCILKNFERTSIRSDLEYIAGDFILEDNPSLEHSVSFGDIITVDGHLSIRNNPELTSLHLLELLGVGGNFEISGNDSLSVINFIDIEDIGGSLIIENNGILEDLSAFNSLNYNSFNTQVNNPEDLILVNNPNLSFCSTEFICKVVEDDNRTSLIADNNVGCQSIDEVLDVCENGIDHDGDGFGELVDCDDQNDQIYPGAEELCDNLDNNCDGEIDEGFTLSTFYVDADMDGYGDDQNTIMACAQPPLTSTTAGDCDDANSSINPGVTEIPDNGIDEDCDGMDLVISTHELSNATIDIFPNPAYDVINIQITGHLEYSAAIYDLGGRLIIKSRNEKIISLDSILSGAYFLEISDLKSGQRIVEKIIISK